MGLGKIGGIVGTLAGGLGGGLLGAAIGNVMKGSGSGAYYDEAKKNLLDTQTSIKDQTQAERDRLLGGLSNLNAPQAGPAPTSVAAQGNTAGTLAQLGILSPFMDSSMDGFGQQFTGAAAQTSATNGMQTLNSDPSAILSDPLFLAQQEAGVRSAEMGAASRGTQLSGGELVNLQQIGQQAAGTALQQRMQALSSQSAAGANLAQTGQGLANLGGNLASTSANLGAGAEQAFGLQNLSNQQQTNRANQDASVQYGLANLGAQQATNNTQLGYNQLISQQQGQGLALQSDLSGSLSSLAANRGASKDAAKSAQQGGLMNLIGTGIGAMAGM